MFLKYVILDKMSNSIFIGAVEGVTYFANDKNFIMKHGVTRAVVFDNLEQAQVYCNEINIKQSETKAVIAHPIRVDSAETRHVGAIELCRAGLKSESAGLLWVPEPINNTIH